MQASILVFGFVAAALAADHRIVIYDGVASQVAAAPIESTDLWLTLSDLTRATKFTLKPEGVCRDDRCIPLPDGRRADFVMERGDGAWFNVSEFGRLLEQPITHDTKHGIWCFGPEPTVQNAHLASRLAPDFTLPDLNGQPHKLSEFRGKKVLLLTWASW